MAVEHHGAAQAHWGYSGAGAAPYWGTLDGSYGLCASGQEQSPVNIAKFLQEDVPDIMPSYKPSSLEVVNNGHTIQVNYDAGSGFEADGVNYNLLQLHFHTPSEHYLDGAPYPMEMHLVHKAEDGTLGVIGVMMKIGEHNPVIEGVWQNAPIEAGGSKHIDSVEINAADLMPASLEYYKYDGSLTTPPCSEGVHWHVLKEPIELSEMQLKAFQALFPVNARPVQPLNDRVITGD
ncbi:MAG: carbonic anhydrase family protein [Rhodospirillales bacterium]|nr:carbonic anhydrase family protein [Alphaproteobacteria bacterium]MCB9981316.1 carbonic anhydrase family protein [Rhodospirillales bacterium]